MEILFALLILISIAFIKAIPKIFPKKLSSKPFRNDKTSSAKHNYSAKPYLFTVAEKKFYDALNEAIDDNSTIFAKVRVADLIFPKNKSNGKKDQAAFNKIIGKHIDYVVVQKKDCGILCAIELDDKSHQRKDRIERDIFLNEAFKSANLPLIRFKCKTSYSTLEISNKLTPYLN